ncbi:MAG: radical SAM protein [Paraclostridium sp.]
MIYLNNDVVVVKNEFENSNLFMYNRFDHAKFDINHDAFDIISYIYDNNGVSELELIEDFGEGIKEFIDIMKEHNILVEEYQEKFFNIKINDTSLCRVFIEITDKCNLKCPHCYGNFTVQNSKELNLNSIEELIKKAANVGIYEFDITGGEPFLYKDLDKVLKLAYEHGMLVTIFSNLTTITEDQLNSLVSYRVKKVNTSIESINKEIHNTFRGMPNSFDTSLKNICTINDYGIETNVNLVIGKHNIDSLTDTLVFFKEKNLCVTIDFISHVGRASENLLIEDYSYKGLRQKVESTDFFDEVPRKGCGVGNRFIFINSSGDFSLCSSLNTDKYVLGNIYIDYSFKDLSDKLKYSFLNLTCQAECEHKEICNGGCRARAIQSDGNITGPDKLYCSYYGG